MNANPHLGSRFDDFLADERLLEETTAIAVKRIMAWRIEQAMHANGVSKSMLAQRMHTSRSVVDRMLDETNPGLTLETMARAATALGLRIKFDLVRA